MTPTVQRDGNPVPSQEDRLRDLLRKAEGYAYALAHGYDIGGQTERAYGSCPWEGGYAIQQRTARRSTSNAVTAACSRLNAAELIFVIKLSKTVSVSTCGGARCYTVARYCLKAEI